MDFGSLARVGFIFLLIEYRIWIAEGNQDLKIWTTLLPIILVWFSWTIHGDNFKTLGLKPADYRKDLKPIAIITVLLWLIILSIAIIWNPEFMSQKNLVLKFLLHLLAYFLWAVLQNLWLNGYFVNRLNSAIKNSAAVSLIAGALFAIVHLPNPVLVAVTLIGGIMSAYFFQRNRNLYLISASHAFIAVSLLYFFPDSWHHHLHIGPGYWLWKP